MTRVVGGAGTDVPLPDALEERVVSPLAARRAHARGVNYVDVVVDADAPGEPGSGLTSGSAYDVTMNSGNE